MRLATRPAVTSASAGAALVCRRQPLSSSSTKLAAASGQVDNSGVSHWKTERMLSVGLLGLIPAAIVAPGTGVDMAIAVLLPIHNHMGMDAIIIDYVKPRSLIPAVKAFNYTLGAGTIAGLTYFNLNDVGICEGMKMLWAL